MPLIESQLFQYWHAISKRGSGFTNEVSLSNISCNVFVHVYLEISLPNEQARMDILKIHAGPITKHGEIGINM